MDECRTQGVPIKVPLRYSIQIPRDDVDIIFEFFMVYSRFGFALKQTRFRRFEGDDHHVAPAWRAFSTTVQERFKPDKSLELRQAYDYYLSCPPKIQVLENGQLSWKKNTKRDKDSDFAWVISSIGMARNNLFHGGKFPWDQVRDPRLLLYGLIILYECLELDPAVRSAFNSSS